MGAATPAGAVATAAGAVSTAAATRSVSPASDAAVAAQLVKHAAAVTEVCRGMYDDALRGTGKAPPGLPDVSVFRVKPHMQARRAQCFGRNFSVQSRAIPGAIP